MASVQDEQGVPGENIEPARPANLGKTLTDSVLRQIPPPLPQHFRQGQHHGGVVELMLSQQGQGKTFPVAPVKDLPLQAPAAERQPGKVGDVQLHSFFPAYLTVHILHGRLAGVDHRPAAGFENACLVGGDFFQGIPQKLSVIQADVGDHRCFRHVDGVGGVVQASHSRLQHHDVTFFPGEIGQGDGGDQLEFRGGIFQSIGKGPHKGGNSPQIVPGNLLTVNLHPLGKAVQVGGGVQSGAVTGGFQNSGGHGGGAAFAVGSGDVDGFQGMLGIAQGVQQGGDPAQARGGAFAVGAVDVTKGFFCGHGRDFLSRISRKHMIVHSLQKVNSRIVPEEMLSKLKKRIAKPENPCYNTPCVRAKGATEHWDVAKR